MKKVISIISIILFAISVQAKKPYFGGRVGWVNHTCNNFGESDSRGGLGVAAIFELPFTDYVGLREQIGYNGFSASESGYIDEYFYTMKVSLRDIAIGNYLMLSIPTKSVVTPYLCGGIGVHMMQVTGTVSDGYSSISETESTTSIGIDLLGGMSIDMVGFNLFFEIGWNSVQLPDDWYDSYSELALMGGAKF